MLIFKENLYEKILIILILSVISLSLPINIVNAERIETKYDWTRYAKTVGKLNQIRKFDIDKDGNIYIAGMLDISVPDPYYRIYDFNFTEEIDEQPAYNYSSFVSKYDKNGNYLWTKIISDLYINRNIYIRLLDVDENSNIYVGCYYSWTIDADPGPTNDPRTAGGTADFFLRKYDKDGNYIWTKTWGGNGIVLLDEIYSDDSYLYVTGRFRSTYIDFDTSTPDDNLPKLGPSTLYDTYFAKLSFDGQLITHFNLGGENKQPSYRLVKSYGDYYYIYGFISGTVDLNPKPGSTNEFIYTSIGDTDIYLSCFNKNTDDLVWAKVWGTPMKDEGHALFIDQSGIYLGGHFSDSLDFDLSDNIDIKVSNGLTDNFLTKYDLNGNYLWTKTWGGASDEYNLCIFKDINGNLYYLGYFYGTTDLNPDPLIFTSFTSPDSSFNYYVSIFKADGTYVRSWSEGSLGPDYAYWGIPYENYVYIVGTATPGTDFDFTEGIDIMYNPNSSTNEQIYLTRFTVNVYNHITNFHTNGISLVADDIGDQILEGKSGVLQTSEPVNVKILYNSNILADANVIMNTDKDWSNVTGISDLSSYKSYMHNLATAEGVSEGRYNLYIPYKEGDNAVWICPNVDSLEKINTTCEMGYYLKEGDTNLEKVEYESKLYWKVSGLTGTGGMSINYNELFDTGLSLYINFFLSSIILIYTVFKPKYY